MKLSIEKHRHCMICGVELKSDNPEHQVLMWLAGYCMECGKNDS